MRRLILIALGSLALAGCQTTADTGKAAARMEMQDDAACRGHAHYAQCRSNLIGYRQLALAEEQQRQAESARQGAALARMGAALQSINPPTQHVDVTVSCSFGRC